MRKYGELTKETTHHTSQIPLVPPYLFPLLNSAFSVSLNTVIKVGVHRIQCEARIPYVVPNVNISEEGWMKERVRVMGAKVSRPIFSLPLKPLFPGMRCRCAGAESAPRWALLFEDAIGCISR